MIHLVKQRRKRKQANYSLGIYAFSAPQDCVGQGGIFCVPHSFKFYGCYKKLVLKVLQSSADEMVYFP